jgi:hypothetical protein
MAPKSDASKLLAMRRALKEQGFKMVDGKLVPVAESQQPPSAPTNGPPAASLPPQQVVIAQNSGSLSSGSATNKCSDKVMEDLISKEYVSAHKKTKKNGGKNDMESLIERTIKRVCFKKIKFANGDVQRAAATEVVLDALQLEGLTGTDPATLALRKRWIEANTNLVCTKINDTRGYAQTQTCDAIRLWQAAHDGDIPPLEKLLALIQRQIDPNKDEDWELMKWWWTKLIPKACANAHDWGADHHLYLMLRKYNVCNFLAIFEIVANTLTFVQTMVPLPVSPKSCTSLPPLRLLPSALWRT